MDNELHSMALIRSLPNEYKSLSQSLMLLDDLNKNMIREAFLAEETNLSLHVPGIANHVLQKSRMQTAPQTTQKQKQLQN